MDMCVHIYTYLHTGRHTGRHTDKHMFIHIFICLCTYVCIYVYIYIHTAIVVLIVLCMCVHVYVGFYRYTDGHIDTSMHLLLPRGDCHCRGHGGQNGAGQENCRRSRCIDRNMLRNFPGGCDCSDQRHGAGRGPSSVTRYGGCDCGGVSKGSASTSSKVFKVPNRNRHGSVLQNCGGST